MHHAVKVTVLASVLCLCSGMAQAQFEPCFIGAWEWLRTEYDSGEVTTPESVGYTRQLVFKMDHAVIDYRDEIFHAESCWDMVRFWLDDTCIELLCFFGDDYYFGGLPNFELRLRTFDWTEPQRLEIYRWRGQVPSLIGTWGSVKAMYR